MFHPRAASVSKRAPADTTRTNTAATAVGKNLQRRIKNLSVSIFIIFFSDSQCRQLMRNEEKEYWQNQGKKKNGHNPVLPYLIFFLNIS